MRKLTRLLASFFSTKKTRKWAPTNLLTSSFLTWLALSLSSLSWSLSLSSSISKHTRAQSLKAGLMLLLKSNLQTTTITCQSLPTPATSSSLYDLLEISLLTRKREKLVALFTSKLLRKFYWLQLISSSMWPPLAKFSASSITYLLPVLTPSGLKSPFLKWANQSSAGAAA